MKTKGARSITDEQIIAALRREHGLITYAARRLRCNARTIHRRVKESSAVAEAITDARVGLLDESEKTIWYWVKKKKNLKAATFVLAKLGRKRGYVNRREISGKLNVKGKLAVSTTPTADIRARQAAFVAGLGGASRRGT